MVRPPELAATLTEAKTLAPERFRRHSFEPSDIPSGGQRVVVVDGDDPIDDRAVQDGRNKSGADALNAMGSCRPPLKTAARLGSTARSSGQVSRLELLLSIRHP